jgi:LmbE family N-acetylglucosaminyl deacetylase
MGNLLDGWNTVLVFGAHGDDEIVGPGGTISRLAARGAQIVVVTFAAGETSYSTVDLKDKMIELRTKEFEACNRVLGISERILLGKPNQGVPNDRDTYQQCVTIIRKYKPDVILTHYFEDKHRDHRAVSQVVDEARWKASEGVLADMGTPWYTPRLYYYEVFELFTHPSLVVDITDTLPKKIEAMETQVTQTAFLHGINTYIEGLAQIRGYLCGSRYGVAFLESTLLPARA